MINDEQRALSWHARAATNALIAAQWLVRATEPNLEQSQRRWMREQSRAFRHCANADSDHVAFIESQYGSVFPGVKP